MQHQTIGLYYKDKLLQLLHAYNYAKLLCKLTPKTAEFELLSSFNNVTCFLMKLLSSDRPCDLKKLFSWYTDKYLDCTKLEKF